MAKRSIQRPDGSSSGQIDIQDPFQLVRHLARSQSDPRKAVAELVQNALDEQASKVVITRRREQREAVLSIVDNGRGVLPHLPRNDALTTIAKSIGQSRKRQMSFDERMRAAMLGQYGIGLLGFWSIGHELRMLSRVNDSEVWCLTLWEDSPKYEVYRLAADVTHGPGTWTEIQVRRMHAAAITATAGARMAAYLSVELRGQLLRHASELVITDGVSRSAKDHAHVVRPAELAGKRLKLPTEYAVPGYTYPVSVQLYYAGDSEDVSLKLACAGAIVEDDLRNAGVIDFAPWNEARLAGVVDFPHLDVPPGSRRGVVPNEAFQAMVDILRERASEVRAALDAVAASDASTVSGETQKQLAKWFKQATQHVPHLDWFALAGRRPGGTDEGGPGQTIPATDAQPEKETPEPITTLPDSGERAQASLLPAGPWTELVAMPKRLKLGFGETRTIRVFAVDADRRETQEEVEIRAEIDGLVSCTKNNGGFWEVSAPNAPNAGSIHFISTARPKVHVTVPFEIAAQDREGNNNGIPKPEEVNEPQATWRSRWTHERWQVNVGHPDYNALAGSGKARLQYLAYLLAKEVIARNFPRPEVGAILEEMVGVLAALERARITKTAK
jgi:hypothetical protein